MAEIYIFKWQTQSFANKAARVKHLSGIDAYKTTSARSRHDKIDFIKKGE